MDVCAVVDHGCKHICANLPDGYECRCRPGYQLKVDKRTCSSNNIHFLINNGSFSSSCYFFTLFFSFSEI